MLSKKESLWYNFFKQTESGENHEIYDLHRSGLSVGLLQHGLLYGPHKEKGHSDMRHRVSFSYGWDMQIFYRDFFDFFKLASSFALRNKKVLYTKATSTKFLCGI